MLAKEAYQPERFVPGHLVMYGSWFTLAKFRFSYLHSLASFEMLQSWSLGTSIQKWKWPASVRQSGERVGPWVELLERRTRGHQLTEKRRRWKQPRLHHSQTWVPVQACLWGPEW